MGGMPIIYNQQYTTDHLFSWINYLTNPLKKVQTIKDFQKLKESYDYSIVAYLPITVIFLPYKLIFLLLENH